MSRARMIICIAVACLAIVAGVVYAGIYFSYHNLAVRKFTLKSEKLDGPVTLVVLADLHDNEFGEDNKELVEQVLAEQPDGVLLAGDFINKYSEDAEHLLELAAQFVEQAPVFFAWGNHELDYMKTTGEDLQAKLEAIGVVVLDETWQEVELAGQTIRIGGLYDYAFALDGRDSVNPDKMKPKVYSFLTEFQETETFKLMLAHRPESFVLGEASTAWDIDLVVSGHMHGGQVVLPFFGGVFGGDQGWFPEYVHGLYEKDLIHIFVTNGLGSGNRKLIPRFNNPPEVAVIRLVPDKEQ